jgi:thiamine biosynthesis protein ThiI
MKSLTSCDGILIRYGEAFLKKGRRSFFIKVLKENIQKALCGVGDFSVTLPHGRIIVQIREGSGPWNQDSTLDALGRVFGIVSMSPIKMLPQDMDQLLETARAMARVAQMGSRRSFKVEARRSDKTFPLSSLELNRRLGSAILQETSMVVDLHNPDWVLGVEVHKGGIWVFDQVVPGPGGLPVGSNGKVLLLLSGGIDSPVAGYLVMKRGSPLEVVYFHAPPYTPEGAREKVRDIVRVLSLWSPQAVRLHVVPFTQIQEAIQAEAPLREAVILYRRSMFRLAERIAVQRGIRAMATGENLGQVASQTVENIHCIHSAATLPVLQPCIAMDKAEIIALAKHIGTYEISIRPYQDCCALFVPKHPELKGDPRKMEEIEARLELEPLYERAIAERETEDVKARFHREEEHRDVFGNSAGSF